MNRMLMIAITTALGLSSAPYGGSTVEKNAGRNTAITETADGTDFGGVQLPNPFREWSTLEQATAAAGFDLTVPESIDGYPDRILRTLVTEGEEMIEVIYEQGEEKEIRIRKATGSGDISGDYNDYAQSEQVTIDGAEVTQKGNDGKVSLATWTKDGYTFSVSVSDGISAEALAALIATIR